ncbi:MAG: bifunctional demethylmenaquinone methyltransferase/2-methoxy-6-polyprenyl-1,4-benzoquinol methylase UbiE [Verrucomicrobiota bacterium]
MPDGAAINQMFAGIAGRYDCANHLLSFGQDYGWRRVLTRMVAARQPQDVVDLATGSGDVAFALRDRLGPQVVVTGMDFCQPMLDEAMEKKQKRETHRDIAFTLGDCMALPLEDASVDAITIAFGVRNFEDRPRGFREILRVLRPGGAAYILEFSQPYTWFRPFYYIYLKGILPLIAGLATGKKDAYQYLAGSIESFPARPELAQQLKEAGFAEVNAVPLTCGIVAIHEALRAS